MDLPTPSQRCRGRPRKAGSPADAERGVTSETIKPPFMFESRKKDIGTTSVTMITIKCVHASSKNRWTGGKKKNKSKFDDFRAVYIHIYI